MSDLKRDSARAADIAEILKSLSHPIRLMIVAHLCDGEANVSELSARLDVPQSIVSQQLRILRMANLVDSSRTRGFAVYRLAQPRLADLLRCLEGCGRGDR